MQKLLLAFIAFAAILFGVHHFIADAFFNQVFFYQVWQIHAFLFIATLVILIVMQLIHKSFPDKTGFAFMAFSILKITFSVLFFIPLMRADLPSPEADVLNFFVPYFLYLTFEAVSAVRLINRT